jgi:hypothetical protein
MSIFQRVKDALSGYDRTEYPILPDLEVTLPAHDPNDEHCTCPDCMQSFLQQLSNQVISGEGK